MRFSVWPNLANPWSEVVATVNHAEATGWDGVYVADHFMGDGQRAGDTITPMYEATAALAALAVLTDRVRLGSLVFGITYRHPAVLANWAASVDQMSNGRLLFGIGAGWQINEHEMYGIELGRPGVRIDRFEEACQVLDALLRSPVGSVEGEYYQVTDAVMEPKAAQDPLPILIGGGGERRMLRIVAEYADIWNTWGTPDVIARKSAVLDRFCSEVGREPKAIARSAQALTFVNSSVPAGLPMPAIGGSAEQLADTVAEYRSVGLDELVVPDRMLGKGADRLAAMDVILGIVRA